MSDGRTYGEVFHGEWAAAQRRFMHKPPAWDDLTPTEQASTQAGALAVAEDVQRRGFAGDGEERLPDDAPQRYALVEQMGHRATTGTVREVTFCGKQMLEMTDLRTGSVHLVAAESLYEITWLTEDEARVRVKPWTATALPAGTLGGDDDDDPEVAENGGVWGFTEADL